MRASIPSLHPQRTVFTLFDLQQNPVSLNFLFKQYPWPDFKKKLSLGCSEDFHQSKKKRLINGFIRLKPLFNRPFLISKRS
jgi:hypothetical protein